MANKAPDAYRSISEASKETGLPAHVLRFWESKFSQIKPMKRAGGRRLYRPDDIKLINGLRTLLYDEGYTIKGAQKYLKDHGVTHVGTLGDGGQAEPVAPEPLSPPTSSSETPASESASHQQERRGLGLFEPGERQVRQPGYDRSRLMDIRDQLALSKARLDAAIAASRQS